MSCNIDDIDERKRRCKHREEKPGEKEKSGGFAKDPMWIKLRTALVRVLEEHPAAKRAVIQAIHTNQGLIPDEEDGDAERL